MNHLQVFEDVIACVMMHHSDYCYYPNVKQNYWIQSFFKSDKWHSLLGKCSVRP